MAQSNPIPLGTLISAGKVNGTTVYNLDGDKLGVVNDIMIDKMTGRAVYAVISFGGFLGMGESHHPLPWAVLKYDTTREGYIVNLDKRILAAAPNFDRDAEFQWSSDYGRRVDSYFDVPGAWY